MQAEDTKSTLSGRIGLRPSAVKYPEGVQPPVLSEAYKQAVIRAVRSPEDLWGQELLSRPEGPTYDNMKDLLTPIMYGVSGAEAGSFMTETGVYYIPFGQPKAATHLGDVALTVADGSQILSNRVGNLSLSTRFYVGSAGKELFGSRLASLSEPELYKRYLPILELDYQDLEGVRYHQESFAGYLPGTELLASFIAITAQRGTSGRDSTTIRVRVCDNNNLCRYDDRVKDDRGCTYMYFSPGYSFYNTDLTYSLDLTDGEPHTIYLVRPVTPSEAAPALTADRAGHLAARSAVTEYWERRLAEANLFQVPEARIMDAQRNLLVQNLLMTWRYSLGNAYQAFYQPESNSTVAIMGRYGYKDVYRDSLRDLLPMSKNPNRRSWEFGEKLTHAADYYRLTGDDSFLLEHLDTHLAFAEDLIRQHRQDPNRLMERQQYSSDVKSSVYGLHQIGTAVYGLQNIAAVWREIGQTEHADRVEPIAAEFRQAFDEAVAKSQVTLPDGSLFTPVALLDDEEVYAHIADTFLGSYWNLVAHYAFACHLYPPGSPEAKATIRYLLDHGSRLFGQIKARDGAINDVYGVKQAKLFADNDEADQLVLTFYGHLAHSLTRNTLIAGESASVGPLRSKWPMQFGACTFGSPCTPPSVEEGWAADEYYRGIYLSPNSANNALFLHILRLMHIHELTDACGRPQALQLAFSTPRGWLEDGNRIQVFDAPSLFGPISYELESELNRNRVSASLELPEQASIGSIRLRLRVPAGNTLIAVQVNGQPHARFDGESETIDLTGLKGTVKLIAQYV